MDHSPRILIVEPKRAYLAVLARRFVDDGFKVALADSAASAIAELHRAPVDLVLAELDMPGTDGAELARMIRDHVQWRGLPIMLVTGKSKPAGAVRGYEQGADDVILKPFHFEVLVARIRRRIDSARALERLRQDNQALDARIVQRAIDVGELKDRLERAEAERARLQASAATGPR